MIRLAAKGGDQLRHFLRQVPNRLLVRFEVIFPSCQEVPALLAFCIAQRVENVLIQRENAVDPVGFLGGLLKALRCPQ